VRLCAGYGEFYWGSAWMSRRLLRWCADCRILCWWWMGSRGWELQIWMWMAGGIDVINWRIAEGFDDSAGAGLWSGQRAGLAPDGDRRYRRDITFDLRKERDGGGLRRRLPYNAGNFFVLRDWRRRWITSGRWGWRIWRRDVELWWRMRSFLAAMTRAECRRLASVFAGSSPAAALTAVAAPPERIRRRSANAFADQFGAVVANGQAEMKRAVVPDRAHWLFTIIWMRWECWRRWKWVDRGGPGKAVEFGSAVRAAQAVYGRETAERHRFVELEKAGPSPSATLRVRNDSSRKKFLRIQAFPA